MKSLFRLTFLLAIAIFSSAHLAYSAPNWKLTLTPQINGAACQPFSLGCVSDAVDEKTDPNDSKLAPMNPGAYAAIVEEDNGRWVQDYRSCNGGQKTWANLLLVTRGIAPGSTIKIRWDYGKDSLAVPTGASMMLVETDAVSGWQINHDLSATSTGSFTITTDSGGGNSEIIVRRFTLTVDTGATGTMSASFASTASSSDATLSPRLALRAKVQAAIQKESAASNTVILKPNALSGRSNKTAASSQQLSALSMGIQSHQDNTIPLGDNVKIVFYEVINGTQKSLNSSIEWQTEQSTIGRVELGLSTEYGYTIEDTQPVTNHCLQITSLLPGAIHYVRVTKGDGTQITSQFETPTQYYVPVYPGDWNCLSLPGEPLDKDPQHIFLGLNIDNYSLQYWNNASSSGGYLLYGIDWQGGMECGVPYWLLPYDLSELYTVTYFGWRNDGVSSIQIPQHPSGPYWVQIASSLDYRMFAEDLKIYIEDQTYGGQVSFSWKEAAALGFVEPTVQGYKCDESPRRFVTVGPLGTPAIECERFSPYWGYWFLVYRQAGIRLDFQVSPVSPPSPVKAVGADGLVRLQWESGRDVNSVLSETCIYRGNTTENISFLTVPDASATSYDDLSVDNGTGYYYKITQKLYPVSVEYGGYNGLPLESSSGTVYAVPDVDTNPDDYSGGMSFQMIDDNQGGDILITVGFDCPKPSEWDSTHLFGRVTITEITADHAPLVVGTDYVRSLGSNGSEPTPGRLHLTFWRAWDSVYCHNGTYSVVFKYIRDYDNHVFYEEERTITINNLLIRDTEVPKILAWDPYKNPVLPPEQQEPIPIDISLSDGGSRAATVRVSIYKSDGVTLVRQLETSVVPPNPAHLLWDGRAEPVLPNAQGDIVEKGIYLYRVHASQNEKVWYWDTANQQPAICDPNDTSSFCPCSIADEAVKHSDYYTLHVDLLEAVDFDSENDEYIYNLRYKLQCYRSNPPSAAAERCTVSVYSPDFTEADSLGNLKPIVTIDLPVIPGDDMHEAEIRVPANTVTAPGSYVFLLWGKEGLPSSQDPLGWPKGHHSRPVFEKNHSGVIEDVVIYSNQGVSSNEADEIVKILQSSSPGLKHGALYPEPQEIMPGRWKNNPSFYYRPQSPVFNADASDARDILTRLPFGCILVAINAHGYDGAIVFHTGNMWSSHKCLLVAQGGSYPNWVCEPVSVNGNPPTQLIITTDIVLLLACKGATNGTNMTSLVQDILSHGDRWVFGYNRDVTATESRIFSAELSRRLVQFKHDGIENAADQAGNLMEKKQGTSRYTTVPIIQGNPVNSQVNFGPVTLGYLDKSTPTPVQMLRFVSYFGTRYSLGAVNP